MFNLDFNDDYSINNEDVPIHKGTLSSIFKRNQRYVMREIKLNEDKSSVVVASSKEPTFEEKETKEANVLFNSKLKWLTSKSDDGITTDVLFGYENEYPTLSQSNNKHLCPKIKDGYKCTKAKCSYDHPQVEEVKQIVSNMRSLKKRVVKDVLKLIKHEDKNSSSSSPSSSVTSVKIQVKPSNKAATNSTHSAPVSSLQGKTKLCKFLNSCKFKSNCRYAHSNEELKINDCQYGNRCKLVKKTDGVLVGKCAFIHPQETRDMYFIRQNK